MESDSKITVVLLGRPWEAPPIPCREVEIRCFSMPQLADVCSLADETAAQSEDNLMDSNIERWYSMKEICEYLGVSRDTVLAWIEKRNMPAAKIGRLWKFKVSEVDAWMKSGVAADK